MTRRPNPLSKEEGARKPLPLSREEMIARGWDAVDVVFVTGDAYVDHPSFAMALLGRVLEAEGYRVAILSQPDWRSCRAVADVRPAAAVLRRQRRQHGLDAQPLHGQPQGPQRRRLQSRRRDRPAARPRHAGLLPAGPRGLSGRAGHRRRRRGQPPPAGPLRLLERQRPPRRSSSTPRPTWSSTAWASGRWWRSSPGWRPGEAIQASSRHSRHGLSPRGRARRPAAKPRNSTLPVASKHAASSCPAIEEVAGRQAGVCAMTRLIHRETNPDNARRLVQYHGREAVVVNPPALPLDRGGDGPRLRPALHAAAASRATAARRIPAYEVVKDSIQIMRGCFGGCTFCSITAHQGRIIQSRSRQSVLDGDRPHGRRARFLRRGQRHGRPDGQHVPDELHAGPRSAAKCRRLSCVHPTICKLLGTDHGPLVELMRQARRQPRREAGLRGLGRPHGPGPAEPGVHRRIGRAPHRRPVEGGPGTHRSGGAAADEEAAASRLRRPSSGSSARRRRGRQEAVPRPVFHGRPSRLRPAGDDRPGRCI